MVWSDMVRSAGLAACLLRVAAAGQIPYTFRPTLLGVQAPGAHCKSVAGAIGPLPTLGDDPHLAFEDQQPRVELVEMLGVCLVRLNPAIGDFEITLFTQCRLEFHL